MHYLSEFSKCKKYTLKSNIRIKFVFMYLFVFFCVLFKGHNLARAEFTVCNNSNQTVSVAISILDFLTFTSEGWWNIESEKCEVILLSDVSDYQLYVHISYGDGYGQVWGNPDARICGYGKIFTLNYVDVCPPDAMEFDAFKLDSKNRNSVKVILLEDKKLYFEYK